LGLDALFSFYVKILCNILHEGIKMSSVVKSSLENPNYKILKNLLPKNEQKTPPKPNDNIPFGAIATNHMLICDYDPQKNGWQAPEITKFKSFSVCPSAVVFHYGQTIFEGLKAYHSLSNPNEIFLFRPDQNAKRMTRSATRLSMIPFPEDLFVNCIKELVKAEKDWILPPPGALYIRPSLISLDKGISYRASQTYRFFIIASPAKSYFTNETGVSVYIERHFSRAALGGAGEAKCGGNYAAALPSLNYAKEKGAEQVLWLDAFEHRYVEEAGAMNVMFVYNQKIITPTLTGSILHGVTRASVIELAKYLGYEVEEKRIEINQIIEDAKNGKLTEMFACGTAVVISPVHTMLDGEQKISINNCQTGSVTMHLKNELIGIQTGTKPDPFGWRCPIF
jgi:branched-chain amino acid aminotransferase